MIRVIAALLCSVLSGCVHIPRAALVGDPTPADLAASPAGPLAAVPFHPQQAHHCGPAALATILGASGLPAEPGTLAGRIYVPGRRGSFQVELIAATRAAGRVPWLVDGSLSAISAELAAGRPVLVLQNLGVPRLPRWHYAVVVGLDASHVTLRSGRHRLLRQRRSSFLRTWNWADRWGFVALRPGEWPAEPEPRRWLEAMSDLEQVGQREIAAAGLEAAVERWPGDPLAWFAAGNSRYRAGDLPRAIAAWREAARRRPQLAPAWNNLAQGLGELGCVDASRLALEQGLKVAETSTDREALETTTRELASMPQPASNTASACSSASGSP